MALIGTAAALALCGAIAGCGVKEDYRLAKVTLSRDPKTGHLIRTRLWEYGDGTTETTVNEVDAQGDDIDRRDPPSHYSVVGLPGLF